MISPLRMETVAASPPEPSRGRFLAPCHFSVTARTFSGNDNRPGLNLVLTLDQSEKARGTGGCKNMVPPRQLGGPGQRWHRTHNPIARRLD